MGGEDPTRWGDEYSRGDSTSSETDDRTSSETDGRSSIGVLGLNHVYDALAHPRRRYLCYTLLEETEWSLTELATKIAAWEHEVAEEEVTATQRDNVYISLYHAHVPRLVDDDVITFDEELETTAISDNAEQVLTALNGMGASLDSDQEYHARGN